MKRFSILFTIVITLTSTCILLTACRANKEVMETETATATGQAAATATATVQSDTAHWQLVYPKTAKTEGDLWRKGNIYTLDTNETSWTVDTTFSLSVFFSIKMDESDSDFTHIDYKERLKCPRGKTFVSFVDSLQQLTDVERIDYHIPPVMLRDISQKVLGKIYKIRKQYYTNNKFGVFGRKIEEKWVDVYINGKPEKEKIAVPTGMRLEVFVDSLERCIDIDSISFIGVFEIVDDNIESTKLDKYFSRQWNLNCIYVQDAWDITFGDSSLVVAILERNGVDWTHFELGKGYDKYQNIYLNNGEDAWNEITDTAGRKTYDSQTGNGLDDDGDELKDNFIGWNFKNNNNDCRTDSCQHGTMVAGIIAAKTNNGRGISGIAGGDSCAGAKIIPYATGVFFMQNMQKIASDNPNVVNMSFNVDDITSNMLNRCNILIKNVYDQCVSLIASSGNDTTLTNLSVRYPASNPHVIAVGAIDTNNRRASFSCFGSELSVVAPGVNIFSITKNQSGAFGSGTSFAAPHVTGVAALMLSVNPNLTPADVRRIIEKTARKVGGYDYRNDPQHPNGTWNEEMGYGLVDAHAAVLNVVDSTLDLYVRDSENDNGDEPSVTTTPWNSPDIWIEDTKGKEVSSLKGLWEYNVCVRIHNRTDSASTGYEKLYLNWVKAGPSSDWSAAWQGKKILTGDGTSVSLGNPIIGEKNRKGHPIPVIPAGRDTVVKVLWTTPEPDYYSAFYNGSELRHFCLCARIHDGRRIGNEDADSINMGEFVKNSSHVAWKNIIIMEAGIQKAPLHVYSTSAKPICLRYAGCANTAGEQLHEYAEVKLKLDTGLYNVWQRGGFTGGGFVLQADSSLLLQSPNAELCSLLLDTSRIYLMQTSVQFNNRLVPQNSTFHADIVQYYEYDENGIHVSELVGGEHYKAVRSGDCEYTVQIAGDTDLLQGETATFTATGAESYRWYNAGGDLLGTAETMTAVPAYSQCYYLETTGGLCGYISRDTVCVHVSEGEIVTLYPNPTNDFVHLEYQITGDYNNASIQITNELGTTQQTVTLNEAQGSVNVDVQELPAGAYYVLLKSPTGRVLDVKTLVKGK